MPSMARSENGGHPCPPPYGSADRLATAIHEKANRFDRFSLGQHLPLETRRAAHRDVRRFSPRQGCRVEKSRRRFRRRVCLVGEGPFLWFVSFWPEKEMNPHAAGGRKLLPFAGKQSRGLAGLPLLRSTSPRWQAWSLRGQKPSAIHPGERTMPFKPSAPAYPHRHHLRQ